MQRMIAILMLMVSMLAARAQEPPAPVKWRVLIEPGFMKPPVSFPIPNAERTLLVPGYINEAGEVTYFTSEQWESLKMEWVDFQKRASANASEVLVQLKPEFTRNKKNVVEFATLRSESPLTAGAVFAPEFLKQFEEIFGSKPLVVIPSRHTVFIFPRLAGTHEQYGAMVRDAYRDASQRVSIEVFEVGADGLRAIGIYPEP